VFENNCGIKEEIASIDINLSFLKILRDLSVVSAYFAAKCLFSFDDLKRTF
jgi:hypothetical protein